jgi:hypothetical protein
VAATANAMAHEKLEPKIETMILCMANRPFRSDVDCFSLVSRWLG